MDQQAGEMRAEGLYTRSWKSLLTTYDEGEAKAVVRLLLDQAFGLDMTDICCGRADELSEDDRARLRAMMSRLEQGEPVQYVLGQASFCGRMFSVGPDVLIPRPETEELCRMIIAAYGKPFCALQPPVPLQVLDVGTGSGCIGVTLMLDLCCAEVTAWDVSPEALLVARKNAHAHGARVNLELQDALDAPADGRRWDVVVSNPPYIACSERREMESRVIDHEPGLALFVPDDDPLRFYRAVATYAHRTLNPGGSLFFEINPRYAVEMRQMMVELGFTGVQVEHDVFGKARFVKTHI